MQCLATPGPSDIFHLDSYDGDDDDDIGYFILFFHYS